MNAILVDVTRCTGCERCADACVTSHQLDPRQAAHDRAVAKDALSADRWLAVQRVADGRFARRSCMHCLEPSCVAACLVGGLTRSPEGPVVYDPTKCIGCRYCMIACPFQVPRYEWGETRPFVRKCDMCADRQVHGQPPACVEACPHEALAFGDRDGMLAEAHARIARGHGAYRPHVWGEHELGGTSVIYVSDVPLEALGWPDASAPPIPQLTVPLIEKTPAIGLSVATGLLGLNWIVRRRMKLAKEVGDAGAGAGAACATQPGGEPDPAAAEEDNREA
ncbi:MAG: 4Fe-4S dicluster domain-containing protein [Candidatus Krumholzibacteriia bacterium]